MVLALAGWAAGATGSPSLDLLDLVGLFAQTGLVGVILILVIFRKGFMPTYVHDEAMKAALDAHSKASSATELAHQRERDNLLAQLAAKDAHLNALRDEKNAEITELKGQIRDNTLAWSERVIPLLTLVHQRFDPPQQREGNGARPY